MWEKAAIVDATDQLALARLRGLAVVHRIVQQEEELSQMEQRERESNQALAARNRSGEQAWGVRRVVEINRGLRPQLVQMSAVAEEQSKQAGAGQWLAAKRRRSPYMLACQEPPRTSTDGASAGGARDGRRHGTWSEVSGIAALPCCAWWRVCWLL